MKNKIFISLVVSLFFGCGGGTSSGSKLNTDIVASMADTILVVENMKKDVLLSSDKENAWFEFADRENIPQGTELSKYTGVLTFRALNGVGSIEEVLVRAANDSGWRSDPITLKFKTVSSSGVLVKKPLKVGDKEFKVSDNGYVVDLYGNSWENNLTEDGANESKFYILARNRCEIKKLKNGGSNWRAPTTDELLDLIDYTKVAGNSMLDDAFMESNLTLWAESTGGKYFAFSQTTGLVYEAKSIDKFPLRCINAPKNRIEHVISTDRFNDITYDFTRSLMWLSMSTEKYSIDQNATEYCANYDNSSGWRLPTINEARSIVEGGVVPYSIKGNAYLIVSSTPYNNPDTDARKTNYALVISKNSTMLGLAYRDVPYPITCVKER